MEISNRSLAFLVVFAIVLSTVSTISLLNRLHMIRPGPTEITGRAESDTGEVNLTITPGSINNSGLLAPPMLII